MKKLLLGLACTLIYACSNDINMFLPRGPQGDPGKSAYELWVDGVKDGTLEWNENTDMSGFFRYLKGADGNSAYDLWCEAVAAGVDDPHNPGRQWSKNATSLADFFRFLSGDDGSSGAQGPPGQGGNIGDPGDAGMSAYALWVQDVQDGDGCVNPHDLGEGLWPVDKVSLYDFWRFLMGEDGADAEIYVPVPVPGEAGKDTTPTAGKANVIVQYSDKPHSEYVADDGSVLFHVLDDVGGKAANAVVTGLPGIPGEVFHADADGAFSVPADKLPTTGTNEERYGATTNVYYEHSTQGWIDAPSAPNTFVPQKIELRLRVCGPVVTNMSWDTNDIEGAAMGVPIVVERRVTDTSGWEVMPAYFEQTPTFKAFELSDNEDPASYDQYGAHWDSWSGTKISATSSVKRIHRPTVTWAAMKPATQAADQYRHRDDPVYVNIVMDSFYGERPHAGAVIELAHVQFHPLPTAMTYASDLGGLSGIKGTYDLSGIKLSGDVETLLFDTNLTSKEKTAVGGETYTFYYPVVTTTKKTIENVKSFQLKFTNVGTTNMVPTPTTIAAPDYVVSGTVAVGSYAYLVPSGRFFLGPGKTQPIGTVTGNAVDGYFITANDKFDFSPIPITQE